MSSKCPCVTISSKPLPLFPWLLFLPETERSLQKNQQWCLSDWVLGKVLRNGELREDGILGWRGAPGDAPVRKWGRPDYIEGEGTMEVPVEACTILQGGLKLGLQRFPKSRQEGWAFQCSHWLWASPCSRTTLGETFFCCQGNDQWGARLWNHYSLSPQQLGSSHQMEDGVVANHQPDKGIWVKHQSSDYMSISLNLCLLIYLLSPVDMKLRGLSS